jgi:hypothetical protein
MARYVKAGWEDQCGVVKLVEGKVGRRSSWTNNNTQLLPCREPDNDTVKS